MSKEKSSGSYTKISPTYVSERERESESESLENMMEYVKEALKNKYGESYYGKIKGDKFIEDIKDLLEEKYGVLPSEYGVLPSEYGRIPSEYGRIPSRYSRLPYSQFIDTPSKKRKRSPSPLGGSKKRKSSPRKKKLSYDKRWQNYNKTKVYGKNKELNYKDILKSLNKLNLE